MKKTRYQKISEDLEQKIVAGEFENRLPGIIRLASQYRTGQATIKKAIQILIDKGFVVTNGNHGNMIVQRSSQDRGHGILALIGLFRHSYENREIIAAVNKFSNSRGVRIIPFETLEDIVKVNPQALSSLPCDGFMGFHPTSELIIEMRRQGLKYVSLNACHNLPDTDWVDFNWAPALEKGLRRLLRQGHRRILFPLYKNELYGCSTFFCEVYRRVMEEAGVFDPSLIYMPGSHEEYFRKYGESCNYFFSIDTVIDRLHCF